MAIISRPPVRATLMLITFAAGAVGGATNPFDMWILRTTAQWRRGLPEFTQFVANFTDIGGAPVTLTVAAVGCLILLMRRMPYAALLLALTVGGERLVVDLLKAWIGRPRPNIEPVWLMPESLAYPSGHAANSMTAFIAVALIATTVRWRWAACVSAILLSVMIGFSRIYLGVHWPTDVLGGWTLGLLAVGGAVTIGRRSGALPLEPQHDIVRRHLHPPGESKPS